MGLIARAIEAEGIPTLSMSSVRDITRAAWPPRAVFLDYPLGHTSGRARDTKLNLAILRETFAAFENLRVPGSMAHLRHRWSDSDRWKDKVFAPAGGSFAKTADGLPASAVPTDDKASAESLAYDDDRVARHPTPQYQTDEDAAAARASHDGEECLVCAGIDF
ncbi:hypothetical protein [Candidatus Poriferisodalis sp.]|uniref:hypothetical protein n=1 Tax=Candidatus Poriferisodalis sp. TaxID=3101277 RepID=UPI003D0EEF53